MTEIKTCVICCGIENQQESQSSKSQSQIFSNCIIQDNAETKKQLDWKSKIAETLGEVLLGHNEHFLVNYFKLSDYCSSCLEVIHNLDYLSKQIKHFQNQLEISANEIRNRLHQTGENECGKPNDKVQTSRSYRIDYYANDTKLMKDYNRKEIIEIVMTAHQNRNKSEMITVTTGSIENCIQGEGIMDFIKTEPEQVEFILGFNDGNNIDEDDNCLGMESLNNDPDNCDHENVIATCSVDLLGPTSSISGHPSEKKQKRPICQYCNETFRTRIQKKRHIEKVHIKPPDFVCPTCGAKFNRKWSLMRHQKKVHNQT